MSNARPFAPFAPTEAYERGPRSAPRPPMIREIEWFDDVSPVLTSTYLVKGLLDGGSMSVIYGPSNSGKTFFALDLAYHVAANPAWRDRRVENGAVPYLAAEGGNGITNRITALRQAHDRRDIPLALRRAGVDLLHPEADVPRIIDLASEIGKKAKLVLIVIDTLSRVLAGGDENGPADMTAFVKNVDRIRHATGAHIMIVHHTGKDAARGARGHSSLRAATDTEIEISADEAGNRTAVVQKQRDYNGGETFHFRLSTIDIGVDQDGDTVRTCLVEDAEHQEATPTTRRLSAKNRSALNALDDALQNHGMRKHGDDWPNCPVVDVEHWRKEFYKVCDQDSVESKRKAFQRARDALRDCGHVQFYLDHFWRCYD